MTRTGAEIQVSFKIDLEGQFQITAGKKKTVFAQSKQRGTFQSLFTVAVSYMTSTKDHWRNKFKETHCAQKAWEKEMKEKKSCHRQ